MLENKQHIFNNVKIIETHEKMKPTIEIRVKKNRQLRDPKFDET